MSHAIVPGDRGMALCESIDPRLGENSTFLPPFFSRLGLLLLLLHLVGTPPLLIDETGGVGILNKRTAALYNRDTRCEP